MILFQRKRSGDNRKNSYFQKERKQVLCFGHRLATLLDQIQQNLSPT